MNKVQWSWTCTLFAGNTSLFQGNLLDAVTHWNNLPPQKRSLGYIQLIAPIDGQMRLDIRALERLILRPDFLDR